jgi:hypothetical protein
MWRQGRIEPIAGARIEAQRVGKAVGGGCVQVSTRRAVVSRACCGLVEVCSIGSFAQENRCGKAGVGGGGREVAEAAKTFLSIPLGQQGLLS